MGGAHGRGLCEGAAGREQHVRVAVRDLGETRTGRVLGTDLITVRFSTLKATRDEYVVVFPEDHVGQILRGEASAGDDRLQHPAAAGDAEGNSRGDGAQRLPEDCHRQRPRRQHGAHSDFAQTQLESLKDYVVYSLAALGSPGASAAAASRPGVDGHAGEGEVSNLMASRPELAYPERSATESGADLNRLELPRGVYTGISWYAKFPNHYQGSAAGATAARGQPRRMPWQRGSPTRSAPSNATKRRRSCRRSSSRERQNQESDRGNACAPHVKEAKFVTLKKAAV